MGTKSLWGMGVWAILWGQAAGAGVPVELDVAINAMDDQNGNPEFVFKLELPRLDGNTDGDPMYFGRLALEFESDIAGDDRHDSIEYEVEVAVVGFRWEPVPFHPSHTYIGFDIAFLAGEFSEDNNIHDFFVADTKLVDAEVEMKVPHEHGFHTFGKLNLDLLGYKYMDTKKSFHGLRWGGLGLEVGERFQANEQIAFSMSVGGYADISGEFAKGFAHQSSLQGFTEFLAEWSEHFSSYLRGNWKARGDRGNDQLTSIKELHVGLRVK